MSPGDALGVVRDILNYQILIRKLYLAFRLSTGTIKGSNGVAEWLECSRNYVYQVLGQIGLAADYFADPHRSVDDVFNASPAVQELCRKLAEALQRYQVT